jgi:pyruvate dehydrogenase complex dihydrolipoamide acetyltransferase long form
MALEIKLPSLSEGVVAGDVLEVFVSEGDMVEKDQALIEIETDKATAMVPSDFAGTVTKIHVGEGDTINVGEVIVTLETSDAPAAAPAPTAPPAVEPPAPVAEAPAPAAPTPAPTPVQAATAPSAPTPAPAVADGQAAVAAGPAMRRLAREVGIDLRGVNGSGLKGRITREDIMQVVRGGGTGTKSGIRGSAGSTGIVSSGSGQSDAWGPVRIEKMPKIRQTIARKMHESWETCPRVTNFDDADVTDLEEMRQNNKADYAERGIKLTTMPFLIKAVAMALKSHPVINASIDMDNGQIIYKEYVHVGIAIDTDRGLVVPALRDADQLAIPDIAKTLSEMATNVRDGKFAIDDLRGGSFTISNLGAIGGTYSTPIINTPETAILLAGRSRKMPVVVGDEIKIRLMMPLSISYDHRLIDGGAAARFLNDVISFLESPNKLLLAL